MTLKLRLYIYPPIDEEDKGDGGVRRVVEAQRKYLPRQQGVDIVSDPGDADIIASHITIPEEFVKRFPDKPMVAHCHGLYWSEYEWMEWAYKANRQVLRAIAIADVVTAPSEWVAQIIRRHTARDVRVVPHGVDMREWQPATDHRGYVIWNKTRPDPVCDPVPATQLARAMPDTPFVLTYGDKRLTNAQITGKLPYEEGKQLVRRAGVYLATTMETFGIGTLEAMAAGVPVVAYDWGGSAEILTHGVDGWLAKPGDIDGLAEGVRWAMENREEIASAGRETARRYPWTTPIRQYKEIYAELFEAYEAQETAPRTSIVVPAFKLDAYLDEALTSVANQTDQSWECIVVDDASPDRCGEIADGWAARDSRFRVIHNETNLHVSGARNAGIAAARGRYILPLDADDKLEPRAVSILADALDADRTLAVAYGGVRFFEEDGVTPSNYGPQYEPGYSGWPPPFRPEEQLQGLNHVPTSSMFRRNAWQQVGGYRRRYRNAEDADFWTRLTSYGFRIKQVVNGGLLYYRNREGSLSRTENARANGHRLDYLHWYPWARAQTPAPAMYGGPHAVSLLEPKISVVIPVGPGHEQLLVDAVDSVTAQTFPFWECIVVKDTPNELPPLPSFVRVIDCDARDTSTARNLGIEAARSELYLPLDADDFLQPEALERLMGAYEQTGGIVYPDFYQDPEEEGRFRPYTLPEWECGWLTRHGCVHAITALTPVKVWREAGGYAPGKNWEDWDFQLRTAAIGACSQRLPEPLFTYRKWTGTRRELGDDPLVREHEFEERKKGILVDWSDYFTGEKTLAGCGCKGTPVRAQAPRSSGGPAAARSAPGQDAVLVEYVGTRTGTIRFRAASGTVYPFGRTVGPRWVLGSDIETFEHRPDFNILRKGTTAAEPLLTA